MRIAVVSPFVDRRHGTERALAELLERLARTCDCEIHLYSQRVEDLALDHLHAARPQKAGVILWHKVPSVPGPPLLQFLAWLFLNSFCRAWDRRAHGLRFDLVLSPGINCLNADVIIVHALFLRLRELAGDQEFNAPRLGVLRRLHRRAYNALLTAFERRIYSDPGVVLAAVSQRTASLLHDYFCRQDVRVIPNGVDTSQFSPASRLALRVEARRGRNFQENDFVLLLIGNDWRVKGLPTVLQAMGALRDLPFHLMVVGSDARDFFGESAKSLGISERCHFEAPRENVLDVYAAADLYVSPSLEDSFGLPVAEAMACGLPVITSAFAGVAGLIQEGVDGFVLPDPRDAQSLSDLFQLLRSQPDLCRRIGDAAAKTALQWTWDRNAAAVYQLLQHAAAQKSKNGSDPNSRL